MQKAKCEELLLLPAPTPISASDELPFSTLSEKEAFDIQIEQDRLEK